MGSKDDIVHEEILAYIDDEGEYGYSFSRGLSEGASASFSDSGWAEGGMTNCVSVEDVDEDGPTTAVVS